MKLIQPKQPELIKFNKIEGLKSGIVKDGKYIKLAEGLQDSSITYNGLNLDGFYSTALLTGSTKNKIRLVPNVKTKANLGSLDIGNVLQADACTVEPVGQYTLDQKTIEVCDLAFNVPFCIKDWEATYLSERMRAGANVDNNFPNGVFDYIMAQLAKKISAQTEILLLRGNTAGSPATLCDGLEKKLLADASVIDVAVDGTKLHGATTVIGELTRMYNAIPETILNQMDENGNTIYKFFLNLKTIRAYRLALIAAAPALVMYNSGINALNFAGIDIIPTPGLDDYKAILCDPMELWYGTDLDSDLEQVILAQDPLNRKIYYAQGSFKFGTNFGIGAQIVYYN